MQVDYENSMSMPPPPNGIHMMPPPQSFDMSDEEEDEEEVQEQQEEGGAQKAKPKRIIKQRQSLSEKQPGTTMFPISRIKKIIKADKDLDMMTSEAVFMVGVATEYFIKHFMEEGYTKARLDKRKLVTYKDIATVVSRSDEFDFLRDVIPMPMPMSEALELRKQKVMLDENPSMHEDSPVAPGQGQHDDFPPLALSTNPLFPNAIVRRPPNTHSKGAGKQKATAVASSAPLSSAPLSSPNGKAGTTESAAPKKSHKRQTPAVPVTVTPQRTSTRTSRRSLAASEAAAAQAEVEVAKESAAEGSGDAEAMDVDE